MTHTAAPFRSRAPLALALTTETRTPTGSESKG